MIAADQTPEWSIYRLSEFIREVWGITLQPWQLQDLHRFVHGGIFAYSIPTDFGKSMLLEMAACVRLTMDPNRRIILVKINDAAAREVTQEVCRRLQFIATELQDHGAPLYPYVAPKIRGMKAGADPWGVGGGFDIEGIDHQVRNINKSFRGYSLGSRDLQGKRGDTMIDDVERQEEAESEAYRRLLKIRVEAVFRTLESRIDALWLIVGTAFHSDSIYDFVCRRLEGISRPFSRIVRPYRNEDGSMLWPERAEKVEVHRHMMSKTAWNAAYELVPIHGRGLTQKDLEEKVRDRSMPPARDQRVFVQWLTEWATRNVPPHRDPRTWKFEIETKIQKNLAFYIGWDPATVGDWGITVTAMLGEDAWVLRSRLDVGDTWEQVLGVRDVFLHFPEARIMLETNGQQKAFWDVAQQDDMLRQANIITGGTSERAKTDPQVGVPAMMERLMTGYFHLPYGDEDWAEREFRDLENEAQSWGPTSHPHLLYAIWFGWRWHRRHITMSGVRAVVAERELARQTQTVKLDLPRPQMNAIPDSRVALRGRTREAWGRRHRA